MIVRRGRRTDIPRLLPESVRTLELITDDSFLLVEKHATTLAVDREALHSRNVCDPVFANSIGLERLGCENQIG